MLRNKSVDLESSEVYDLVMTNKKRFRHPVCDELRRGERAQSSELKQDDVGRTLAWSGWGPVQTIDVGKRVWLRSWGFVMENNEQRDRRRGRS